MNRLFKVLLFGLIVSCGHFKGAHAALNDEQLTNNGINIKDLIAQDQAQNVLDDLIRSILLGFKANMSSGWPGLGIPILDPFQVPAMNLDINQPLLKLKGNFSEVHVDGLSSFDITNIRSNLITLTIELGLALPAFSIKGDYEMDGLAALIFPIYGKGPFSITISGVQLTFGGKIVVIFGGFRVTNLQYNLTLSDINVKFEGLLGGGDLGDTINDIINSLGIQIFEMVEPLVHDTLVDAITQILNEFLGPSAITENRQLADATRTLNLQLPSPGFNSIKAPSPYADAGQYLDQVLANLRHQMIMNGLDKIDLPDSTLEFSRVVLGVRWHGIASLYSGVIRGIETIHRSGDANLVLEPNGDIVFDAELSINDGTLYSSMLVKFMGLGPTARITGTLRRVKVQIQCRVAAGLSNVTMEVLNIKDLGYLSIDVSGLGLVLNFLIEIVSEFLGNSVKGLVANIIEVPVKNLLNTIVSNTAFTSSLPMESPGSAIAAVVDNMDFLRNLNLLD